MTVRLVDNCDYDDLVYVLSHDLRAPARALRQYVILLNEESTDGLTDDAVRFMGRLGQVLDRLDGRLDAILRLSRLGRNSGTCQHQEVSRVFRAALDKHGVPGTVQADMPEAWMDMPRLEYLADELIANVKHHAGEGAQVEVSHDGRVFWVRDNGAGIARRIHGDVFMVFRPVPHPDSSREGMGLSCVSRIVRSVGGTIGIEIPEGGGTHVHFTLPTG